MAVPTLIHSVNVSSTGSHRILAPLEGRVVPQASVRCLRSVARSGRPGWRLSLAMSAVFGAVLVWYFWPQNMGHQDAGLAASLRGSGASAPTSGSSSEHTLANVRPDVVAIADDDGIEPEVSSAAAAAIIEEWVASGQASIAAADGGNMRNPLVQLTATRPGPAHDEGARTDGHRLSSASALPRSSAPGVTPEGTRRSLPRQEGTQDTAVLNSLLAMGLPESSLAGVSVAEDGGVRVRVVPMDQISARLQACDAKSFFLRPACRAQVCDGIHGVHPGCSRQGGQSEISP